jgi:hypothetical protein
MYPSGESSHRLHDGPVPPRQLVSSSPFFFLKKHSDLSLENETICVRFGSIAVFVEDVRDDERTIWCHTHWGRGGPQCEAHARWGRGGLIVIARQCCGPIGGRRRPSPIGPRCHGVARGRGGHAHPGPHTALGKFFAPLFSQKHKNSFCPFFFLKIVLD